MIAPLNTPPSFDRNNVNNLAIQRVPEANSKTRSATTIPQCRICLQSQADENNKLVTPCSCTGSVQYIHVNCFKVWIEKKCSDPKAKAQIFSKKGINCEICNQKYNYEYNSTCKCASSASVCNKIKKYKFFTVALFLFIILDLGMLIALSWFAQNDKKDNNYDITNPRYFLIHVSILVSVGGLLFVLYELISVFLVESQSSIIPKDRQTKAFVRVSRNSKQINLKNENQETNLTSFGLNNNKCRNAL